MDESDLSEENTTGHLGREHIVARKSIFERICMNQIQEGYAVFGR